MSSWSNRRKYAYFFALVIVLALVVAGVFFGIIYKAPTCSDGKQNGEERGVDCGGACTKLCPADFAAPRVQWSYFLRVVPGVYNVMAYVENPNLTVEAKSLSYIFKLYDDKGVIITEKKGSTFVPAGQKFAVFEGGLRTGERFPFRATFEFTSTPQWRLGAIVKGMRVTSVDVTEGAGPRAEAAIKNETTSIQGPFDAFIVLYGADGNRIAFSKTVVDQVGPGQSAALSFTWPEAFPKQAVKKEVILVAKPKN